MRLRHQLAVYSPITLGALSAAAGASLALNSGAIDELANLVRREYSADGVALCGSGTQALQAALQLAREELGSDALVALPAFSCFDVASAAIGAGARVVLYDLDPGSLSPNIESLENALVAGARIVVVAPLYGVPVDWQTIQRVALSRGALLVEDAAQGHGASFRGKPLGSFGEVSTLSFGRGKGWTGGSGGAVMVRRMSRAALPSLAPAPRFDFRTLVQLDAQFALGRPAVYGIPRSLPGLSLGETVYHPPRTPAAMSRAAAGAALATHSRSLAEARRRRAAAEWLNEEIGANRSFQRITSAAGPDASPGYLRFPVLAQRGLAGFADRSGAERVGVAPTYPRRLDELPELASSIVNRGAGFPGASRLVEELVTFPSHSLTSAADRKVLSGLIREYAAS
jgi:dTDP-4-amino-4,6-dideoxygalactose transaminase